VLAAAYAAGVRSLVAVIGVLNTQIAVLHGQVEAHFGRHPAVEIYRSQPGLGDILGARVLGEFGDDPHRYADARARKNYAGTSPITRASGRKKVVLARYARNDRLAAALHQQAFCALNSSPGARAYYDTLRARGTGHHAALRQLANRSASCTAASKTAAPTTSTPPGPTTPSNINKMLLDTPAHGMSGLGRPSPVRRADPPATHALARTPSRHSSHRPTVAPSPGDQEVDLPETVAVAHPSATRSLPLIERLASENQAGATSVSRASCASSAIASAHPRSAGSSRGGGYPSTAPVHRYVMATVPVRAGLDHAGRGLLPR
jgi:hypothetical protein